MDPEVDHSRRGFLRGRPGAHAVPLPPPWALPEQDFLRDCTRCGDCVPACPTKILVAGEGGYPRMNFDRGACTFCAACVEACDTGALRRASGDQSPWPYRARVSETCLAHRGVECRICGEHCDATAIRFSLRPGGPPLPDVCLDTCTGCGACVAPCPVAAIRIA